MIRLGVDVGGTFTDLVLYGDANQRIRTAKVLTTPDAPEEGVFKGLKALGLAPDEIGLFMHATTLVTNLVIERAGARVGLLTTRGHEDLLEIQFTVREEPYNLQWDKAQPLVPGEMRIGIGERLCADGSVWRPLDESEVETAVQALIEQGAEAIAICFLHSYRNDAHELQAREVVRRAAPNIPVCISSEVDPQIREYPRLSTTVLNAYSMPGTRAYIDRLSQRARTSGDIMYMHSGGGVLPAQLAAEFPVYLIQSGPAAGVLGASFAAAVAGYGELITMDMGGTSCDVSIVTAGKYSLKDTVWVEWMIGARLQSIDINSIGAGGGSIVWVDSGGRLRIGPQSAGADPGPVCYGRGGMKPTTTDANLVLGILNPSNFLGGKFVVNQEAAAEALAELGMPLGLSSDGAARGIFTVVNASMAQAIREITVERGIDPRSYTLVAFGGAGGQHAAAVADEIGIRRVLYPSYGSVLSAFGLTTADITYPISRSHVGLLDDLDASLIQRAYKSLTDRAVEAMQGSSHDVGRRPDEVQWAAGMRYRGQTSELRVLIDPEQHTIQELQTSFHAEHLAQYGTQLSDPIELVNFYLTATKRLTRPATPVVDDEAVGSAGMHVRRRKMLLESSPVTIVQRANLKSGAQLESPLIIEDIDSTIFVPSGWQVSVERHGHVVAERST